MRRLIACNFSNQVLFACALCLILSPGCSDSSGGTGPSTPTFLPGIFSSSTPAGGTPDFQALLFTKTVEFRHDSISGAVTAIQDLGNQNNFSVDATEDSSLFNDAFLAHYKVVIFLNTSGDVLNTAQENSFVNYMTGGGGFVGVHAAAASERNWPFYGQLVGAFFQDHPAIQSASFQRINSVHPSTSGLPGSFVFTDEIYNFQTDPSSHVNVLITVDESSYSGGNMGPNHPVSWFHTNLGGRAWYTNLGHRAETFSDSLFLTHLTGGIRYAAKQTP
jgi:type 1 glutamine amidotransferase